MLQTRSVMVIAALACGTAWVSPALAQIDDKAKAVLTQSAKAVGDAKTVSYKAHKFNEGPFVSGILDVTGEVRFQRVAGDRKQSPFYATGVSNIQQGKIQENFTVAQDSGMVAFIDEKKKTVFERPFTHKDAEAAVKKGGELVPEAWFSARPFDEELSAEKLELDGAANIGGEVCDVVKATMRGGKKMVIWSVSTADHLPRRYETRGVLKDQTFSQIVEMTDMKVNPKLAKDDWRIATPAGFSRDLPAPTPPPVGSAAPAPAAGIPAGEAAPAFELAGADGKTVSLSSLKGNVAVLTFFGTGFEQSIAATDAVQAAMKDYSGKNVRFLGLACRESSDEAPTRLFNDKGYGYPLLLKADPVAKQYQVRGSPTVVVIGADGKVVGTMQGFPGEDQFKTTLAAAIQKGLESSAK